MLKKNAALIHNNARAEIQQVGGSVVRGQSVRTLPSKASQVSVPPGTEVRPGLLLGVGTDADCIVAPDAGVRGKHAIKVGKPNRSLFSCYIKSTGTTSQGKSGLPGCLPPPPSVVQLNDPAVCSACPRYLPVVMAVWAAERAMNGISSDQIWGTRFLIAIPLLVSPTLPSPVYGNPRRTPMTEADVRRRERRTCFMFSIDVYALKHNDTP